MRNFIDSLINIISPKTCVVCGQRLVVGEHLICGKCNLHLPRTGYADNAYDNEMAQVFWQRIPIERCAAFMFFHGGSQSAHLIYDMKYHNHPEIGDEMGEIIACEFTQRGFFDGIDLIVPVPLTKKRQRERGYNQSEEIANGVARITGLTVANNVVKRNKFTESQVMKDRWERTDNVNGAFKLVNGDKITGKHVLVIDDIVTTGATICACGGQLAKAGNVRISVLSIGFAKS